MQCVEPVTDLPDIGSINQESAIKPRDLIRSAEPNEPLKYC
ncbi:hypothetical protein SynBOUM118_01909 [Synechococcus sp. BOUM118]|nr:hypothetical protein SynBOUM118_01909 [Synechococcus sp. BOUM118]QNJ17483.1 hypothetical protein SynA1840_01948 [Synechococcus sp. A18-40]